MFSLWSLVLLASASVAPLSVSAAALSGDHGSRPYGVSHSVFARRDAPSPFVPAVQNKHLARRQRCLERPNVVLPEAIPNPSNNVNTGNNDTPVVNPPTADTPAPYTPPANTGGVDDQSGDATYFHVGLGACGNYSNDGEFICAVSAALFDSYPGAGDNPNNNPVCGRMINLTANGRSVTVRVEDRCPECSYGSLDLSPAAFGALADLGVGRMPMTWHWA